MRKLSILLCLLVGLSFFSGCVTLEQKDYASFRKFQPKSVLVLPPLNNSIDERASYSYLSTVSQPLAEMGYYVYPVAVVDHFLKENGLPTPGEMHQIPLYKVDQIIGADAVLYIEINEYGTEYMVLQSFTTVSAAARLVDVKTGEEIWRNEATMVLNSGGNSIAEMLISAVAAQIINSSTDAAHGVSKTTNFRLMSTPGQGLILGHRHPKFGLEQL
jgi:hypothetical protein